MKKLFLLLGLSMLLAGCNLDAGEEVNDDLVDIGDLGSGYDLIRDKNTGCIYVRESSAHSYPLTPYYGEDGQVQGCGEKELDKSKYE